MLCAGIIHGDLSEYNVLVDRDGPVIIDLPQAVDAAGNNNAAAMLQRDVANITHYFSRSPRHLPPRSTARKSGHCYERGALHVDTDLTGHFATSTAPVDVHGVMREISDVRKEHEERERYKAELADR